MKKWVSTEHGKASQRARRQLRIDFLNLIKQQPCTDCGGTFIPEVMDFDHARGKKEFAISDGDTVSFTRLEKELTKCDVVCANCHRIRTYVRRLAKGDSP